MSASRRSLLQVKILIQLDEKPARTITELAEQVQSQRPSVSRSLRILKQQNLVKRNHAGWFLTDEGKREAEEARVTVAKMAETTKSMIARTNDMVSRLSESALASMSVFDTAALVAPYADKVATLSDSMRSSLLASIGGVFADVDIAAQLGAATASILNANQYNLRLMDELLQFKVPAYLEEFSRPNNALLAHITDNLFEMRQLQISAAALVPDFADLIQQTTRVNTALDDIWRHSFKDVVSPVTLPAIEVLSAKVTLPTWTVTHYTDAVTAHIQEGTGNEIGLSLAYGPQEELGDYSLDPLLSKLNPDLVELRRGSWSALFTGSCDRLRHAATSQRELVRQILQILVPDAKLPEDLGAGKPHIKARVKAALGGSKTDTEFVMAISEAILTLYEQLNKYTHHNEKHEGLLRAVLRTGEGLLLFILTALDSSDRGQ